MNKKISILLIMPDGRIHKLKIGKLLNTSFREAPLTLTTLAALVPKDITDDITIVDMSIGQKPPDNKHFDIVGISVMTGTSTDAYRLSDYYKTKGSTVVLGGVHVTLNPDEALNYCDTIVTGFAELTWSCLLNDYINGSLKKIYSDNRGKLTNLPHPRRDLQKKLGYMIPNTVFMTRGCKNRCDFCSVPAADYGWNTRPIGDIIEEIKKIKSKRFAVSDVHLTNDRDFALQLFKEIIPLKKKWGALASTKIAEDHKLLEVMQKSGCTYLLLGFESFNEQSLKSINKSFNQVKYYKNVVDTLHRYGILIQGCFIFGFDEDDKTIFDKTVHYVNELKIDIPRYAIYTPYPGTPLYKRLESENRLLHKEWYYYDTQHVVFKPAKMTPLELDKGFINAYKNTFKISSNIRRSIYSAGAFPITFTGNLAYKLYIKRLKNDNNRFPKDMRNSTVLKGGQ